MYEGVLSAHIDDIIFIHGLFMGVSLITFIYLVCSGPVCIHCQSPALGSGKRGIREQRLHIVFGVTNTLDSIGLICDFSGGLNVPRGESDLPSIWHILEVPQKSRRPGKDPLPISFRPSPSLRVLGKFSLGYLAMHLRKCLFFFMAPVLESWSGTR